MEGEKQNDREPSPTDSGSGGNGWIRGRPPATRPTWTTWTTRTTRPARTTWTTWTTWPTRTTRPARTTRTTRPTRPTRTTQPARTTDHAAHTVQEPLSPFACLNLEVLAGFPPAHLAKCSHAATPAPGSTRDARACCRRWEAPRDERCVDGPHPAPLPRPRKSHAPSASRAPTVPGGRRPVSCWAWRLWLRFTTAGIGWPQFCVQKVIIILVSPSLNSKSLFLKTKGKIKSVSNKGTSENERKLETKATSRA